MKRTKFNLFAVLSLFTALAFTACSSSDDEGMNGPDEESSKGTANVSATDAAVDAENITGVYLAVKGMKADGVDNSNDAEIMFESTQEFNLMAYQNGATYGLGSMDLEAGSYSNISFILDESKPAYVRFKDNTESTIDVDSENSNEYKIVGNFEIRADAQTDIVADVDLRKALKEKSNEGEFKLRATARLVEANISGTIKGSIDNYEAKKQEMEKDGSKAKFVVYAYAQGSYNANEKEDQDGSGAQGRFENSINSAVVSDNGEFTIAFMEEADYEIVVSAFKKSASAPEEEPYEFDTTIESKLSADTSLDVILDGLTVNANSSTNITIDLALGS